MLFRPEIIIATIPTIKKLKPVYGYIPVSHTTILPAIDAEINPNIFAIMIELSTLCP